jgi:hypothetical protein
MIAVFTKLASVSFHGIQRHPMSSDGLLPEVRAFHTVLSLSAVAFISSSSTVCPIS